MGPRKMSMINILCGLLPFFTNLISSNQLIYKSFFESFGIQNLCENRKCYDSSFICINPSLENLSNGDGGPCVSFCSPPKCFNSDFHCVSPGSNYISENNGGLCVSKCESTKCFNFNFVCVEPSSNYVSNNDGMECTKSCKLLTQCFDYYTGKCTNIDAKHLAYERGGQCLSVCDEYTCYDPDFICRAPSKGRISNGWGGPCDTYCYDNEFCYDEGEWICRISSEGRISHKDGGMCQSQCFPLSYCYDPFTYLCIRPHSQMLSTGDGKSCIAANCYYQSFDENNSD